MKKLLVMVLTFCFLFCGILAPPFQEKVYATGTITPQISSGRYHNVALGNDGTIWTWGRNTEGQLGDGTTTQRNTPIQVSSLTNIIAITSGADHSIALKNDGTVWTCGNNSSGQLGDGTTTQRNTPVQVSGLSNVTAIAGGEYHSIALKSDGSVWTWGDNDYGQLGDGTTTQRNTPVQVSGMSNAIAIKAGNLHSICLKSDGTVWTWGKNSFGQLGDGTTTNRTSPVQVSGLSNVTAIAGGEHHNIALKSDGTVWTWGNNEVGQLGDGTTTNQYTPVQVTGMSNVSAIAGGSAHTIALKSDGTVWTWGQNSNGQLGDGTTTNRTSPVQVSGMSNAIDITGGNLHSICLKNDGTVWGWGNNTQGQVGDGTTASPRTTPVQSSLQLFVIPSPPSNLTATVGDSQVSLSWDAATGATGYNIKRAETSGGPYTTIASSITEITYTDTGLTNSTTYYYVVSAINAGGESGNSNEASATPQEPAPGVPNNLTATAGDSQVSLSWTAVTGASGYNMKRSTSSGGPYTTIASSITEITYTDTGLTNGTTYYYVVSAINTGGESNNSNEASATPQGAGGNRAILELTMTNDTIKGYDLSATELNAFLNWYEARSSGTGPAYFALSKAFINGPFVNRKEYVSFDKIFSFEVMEY